MALLRNNAFKTNPRLRRYPVNPFEWSRWIKELNDQDLGDVEEFTPTWTGFSADPGGLISFITLGSFCIVFTEQTLTGTSDATTFTITNLPSKIAPATNRWATIGAIDNGTQTLAAASITPSTSTITFLISVTSGTNLSWSSSGWTGGATSKGIIQGSTLVYSLVDKT